MWVTKVDPQTKTCNILTRAKNISMKFCQLVADIYSHILANFGWFILIFSKMALIFYRSNLYLFYSLKFQVSLSEIAVTLSPISPNSLDFSPLDYQVCGKLRAMLEPYHSAATEADNSKLFSNCISVDLVCSVKPLTTLWKTTPSDCRQWQPTVDV